MSPTAFTLVLENVILAIITICIALRGNGLRLGGYTSFISYNHVILFESDLILIPVVVGPDHFRKHDLVVLFALVVPSAHFNIPS